MTGTRPWASHLIASNQFIGGDVKGCGLAANVEDDAHDG